MRSRTKHNILTKQACTNMYSRGLAASLYSVAKGLARQLELPLTLNASMAPPALRKFNTDPTAHKSDNVPPEIALIATVIMAVKMIYGLDGRTV